MKIALFFLIVGLSGCSGSGNGQCKIRMDKKQAEGLTVSVLDMVNAYCNLKDSCDFRCFWEKISLFMRMVATATNCNVRVVTRNWINCMDNLDEKTKIAMEDAICKEDFHALLALQLPHEILLKCIGNFMEKLFRSHGYDCGEMIDNLLLSLCGAWVDPTNILSTLMHVCGFPLGVVMQNVNGVMCLVKGAVFAKIGNLLNIPYAIVNSLLFTLFGIRNPLASVLGNLGPFFG